MSEFVICIDSTDGHNTILSFGHEVAERTYNFGVLGEHIKAAWPKRPNSYERKWGTSHATLIAAGIVALLLGFSWQPPRKSEASETYDLSHPGAMRLALLALSKRCQSKRMYDILVPWEVFKKENKRDGVAAIITEKVKVLV
jgi:hypothetical protein